MMKKVWASVIIFCLIAALFTGCGQSAKADLQKDLDMYNSTVSQFTLAANLNLLLDRNANLLAGNWKKDSEEFKTIQKDVPKVAKDSIKVVKGMSVKTPEGKKLKASLLAYFQLEIDLLNKNIKAIKSGNASDKQAAMEMNVKTTEVQKNNIDAMAELNAAINVKK
jgi:hypothetical protein